MAKIYSKNTWIDEVLADVETYDLVVGGTPALEDVTIDLIPAITQAGSSVNAARMNNIENGIDGLDDLIVGLESEKDAINATSKAETIATGVITLSANYTEYVMAAESGTADDLVTVTLGPNDTTGKIIILRADAGDTISLLDTGNIEAEATVTETSPTILRYNGTKWQSIIPESTDTFVDSVKGRLTLTSGTPVTTADVTAAVTLYFALMDGNVITLYDGSSWADYEFAELSKSLAGLAASTNFDVFIELATGAAAIATLVAWTNATTRATALAYQDGRLVLSGSPTKRYVGTIRTTSTTGQTEDSEAKRFVWNYYNRKMRRVEYNHGNSGHTYATTTWRAYNNDTSKHLSFILGVVEHSFVFKASSYLSYYGAVGVGVNASNTIVGVSQRGVGSSLVTNGTAWANARSVGQVGLNKVYYMQYGNTSGGNSAYNYGRMMGVILG